MCDPVTAFLSIEALAMIPDETAESLLLAISGDSSGDEMDTHSDLFTLRPFDSPSALDTLPSLFFDGGMDDLGDLSCMFDSPSQSWLPTAYIPGLLDDGLCIC